MADYSAAVVMEVTMFQYTQNGKQYHSEARKSASPSTFKSYINSSIAVLAAFGAGLCTIWAYNNVLVPLVRLYQTLVVALGG
jgi:hypothetical protein